MASATRLATLTDSPEVIAALSDLLIEVVANGGSVCFMHPLAREAAADFWKDSLARAASGGRVVLGAWEGEDLAGTVTLDLATPPNQPHRGEVNKLMTRVKSRGRGIARSLMLEAERIAVERSRTLLVLDTAADGGAAGLYEGIGYQRVGVIPGYSLKPHGGLTGTIIYFKPIGPAA
ncbi:MAG TPA: GNAT family N-acetyltransferase [Candidatus Binataceae bacterium]|nr:GNAT family N-acetyltransferase [Candidatus Binataceae bacterium]